jgi:hypothetical protein
MYFECMNIFYILLLIFIQFIINVYYVRLFYMSTELEEMWSTINRRKLIKFELLKTVFVV